VWAAPGAVRELSVSGGSSAEFVWSAPASPGTFVPRYDLLRGTSRELSSPVCLLNDAEQDTATDDSVPGEIYYYLVRVRNGCGENAGVDSTDDPRDLEACP
jgi:hypothetical protein